ncbi:MAG TPA: HEPN domain-containing protein [Dehalococcoidia bacterium]|nr:HEPN domain-containing protein [Dehalococcoidia bacterium]
MVTGSRRTAVRHLLKLAREDLQLAEDIIAGASTGLPRHACFNAQQAAEKTLKGALRHEGIQYGKVHDLEQLRGMLPGNWAVKAQPASLQALTEWVIEGRYLENLPDATDEDARLAVQEAREVWTLITAELVPRGFDVNMELP